MTRYADEVASGHGQPKLRIAGRPRIGTTEDYVLLEEPGEPVLMHFQGRHMPHFRRACPYCNGTEEPRPLWYLGGQAVSGRELVIVELTAKCFRSAWVAAGVFSRRDGPKDLFGVPIATRSFRGLLLRIHRANFLKSPRVLRCEQRVEIQMEWPYRTREELARIWGVPIRPRIYREA